MSAKYSWTPNPLRFGLGGCCIRYLVLQPYEEGVTIQHSAEPGSESETQVCKHIGKQQQETDTTYYVIVHVELQLMLD